MNLTVNTTIQNLGKVQGNLVHQDGPTTALGLQTKSA
jgi:hypothetical protein